MLYGAGMAFIDLCAEYLCNWSQLDECYAFLETLSGPAALISTELWKRERTSDWYLTQTRRPLTGV
jgi:hypothetical protein